jgi:hypothetical protein
MASVQRNLPAALVYAAVSTLLNLVLFLGLIAVGGDADAQDAQRFSVQVYDLVGNLVMAAALAALQTVVFARLGREIDRPLWRSPNAADAMRRFFQLWLILNLIAVAIGQLLQLAGRQEAEAAIVLLVFFYMLVLLFTVPVGACIMFSGAFEWREIGSSLAPLVHQAPRTLILLLLNLFQVALLFELVKLRAIRADEPAVFWTVFMLAPVAMAYIDCVVFAGTWHICIEHRNADQDVDFDF